jgi:hypothetical protein
MITALTKIDQEQTEEEIQETVKDAVNDALREEADDLYHAVLLEFEDEINDRLAEVTKARCEELWEQLEPEIREQFEQ